MSGLKLTRIQGDHTGDESRGSGNDGVDAESVIRGYDDAGGCGGVIPVAG